MYPRFEVKMSEPIILVHGGAWAMPDDACAAHQQGVEAAAEAGWRALAAGAS